MESNGHAVTTGDILRRKTLDVHQLEAFGGTVYVRQMYGNERSELERKFMESAPSSNPGAFRAKVLILCLVDEHGERLLSDSDATALLENNSADEVERVFEFAADLNGLRERDLETIEGES